MANERRNPNYKKSMALLQYYVKIAEIEKKTMTKMKTKIEQEDWTEDNFYYSLISRVARNLELRLLHIIIKKRSNRRN